MATETKPNQFNYTKGEANKLLALFNQLGEISGFSKFSYFVAKNKTLLLKETKDLFDVSNAFSEPFKEYDQKRVELNVKYANKDANGQPVIQNNNYVITPEAMIEFQKEFQAIRKEYKDAIDQEEKRAKSFHDLQQEKLELPFYTIKQSDIPNAITGNQLTDLLPFVLED